MRRTLFLDDRPRGKHGIGRFARETMGRMAIPHHSLGARGNPAHPRDVIAPARLRLGRGDVVYTPGFNAGLTRAEQVVTLHDLIHLQDPQERSLLKSAFYERVVRPAVTRAGVVVTVSQTSERVVRDWLGNPRVRVVDVGNGCSDQFFRPWDRPATSTALGLLYVGSMKPHKDPETVFRAAARLPEATLTVVSNETDTVSRLAEQHGIVDRVRMRPDCSDDELRALYATSSCLLFPSLYEGFGLPAVEATAMGCPVIYRSDCESVHEIVGGIGSAMDDADPAAWADAVERCAGARVAAPDDWADRYSWSAVAARLDALLGEVTA